MTSAPLCACARTQGDKEKRPRRRHKQMHDLSDISSVGFKTAGSLDEYRFNMFMRDLLTEKAKDIFRCKGVLSVHVSVSGGPAVALGGGLQLEAGLGILSSPWRSSCCCYHPPSPLFQPPSPPFLQHPASRVLCSTRSHSHQPLHPRASLRHHCTYPLPPLPLPPAQGYGNKKFVFQGVHETICYGPADKPWAEGEQPMNQIVFIGRGLDRKVSPPVGVQVCNERRGVQQAPARQSACCTW